MEIGIQAVMLSIPERAETRKRTLEQLSSQGIFPRITIQDNPRRGGRAHQGYQKAVLAKSLHAKHILFLEDDLDIGRNFVNALNVSEQSGLDVVTFYCAGLQFYPAAIKRAIQARQEYTPGLYRLVNKKRFFGSQALLLKSDFLRHFLDKWPRESYLDTALARLADEIYLYAPNPIQHYGACLKSTWSPRGRPHASRSYID